MPDVDVIVIGGGPAGEVCATRLGKAGLDVVLVEDRRVGGECAYWACMPSKALLRPAQLLREVARVPGVRGAVAGAVDAGATLRRRDEVVHELDDASKLPALERSRVRLVRGHGRLTGVRTVEVNGQAFRALRAVVVATGSTAAMPEIAGLAESTPWTNREATTACTVPESLIVLGGGPVGVELAQAWRSLGSTVTLVEEEPRVLADEERFAGTAVANALRSDGISIRLGVRAVAATRRSDGVRLDLDDGSTVNGREILVATGRRPGTTDLGLESVGLDPTASLGVNDVLRVDGTDWLYAVGDVNGRALLTHAATYQARIAVGDIVGSAVRLDPLVDGRQAPRVVFTDPQVAAVGHTYESASTLGLDVVAVEAEIGETAAASFHGRGTPGTARILVDARRETIVGATFVGYEVAELLHAATIAIIGRTPVSRLAHALPAFPTRAEVWLDLLDRLGTHGR